MRYLSIPYFTTNGNAEIHPVYKNQAAAMPRLGS
jgi:hypothetical protein